MEKKQNIFQSSTAKVRTMAGKPWIKWPVTAVLLAVLLLLPVFVNSYIQRILIMILLYAVLSLSLNYVVGYLGEISLGHAAFYAIGAFTSVFLTMKCGINFFPATLIGALTAALFGVLLALLTMRMTGIYLAVTTMGFLEVIRAVILNWKQVTGGSQGISNIVKPSLFGFTCTLTNGGYYYLILAILLLAILVTALVMRSKMGRAFLAIREDSLAAQFVGINLYQYKIWNFTLSGFFAGLAGGFYAHFLGYINNNTFTYAISVSILCMVILGGMGYMKGAIIGAVILAPMSEILRALTDAMSSLPSWLVSNPERWRFVIYGLVLVLMMRFRPQGLLGGKQKGICRLPKGVIRRSHNGAAGG